MEEPETTAWPLSAPEDTTARAWLRAGGPPGTTPRHAASVCLLRDGREGPEVLWITRGRQLSVAPGRLAFPGGAVDDVDRRRRVDEPGRPDRFMVLARAAARELAEETGHRVPSHALRPLVRWVTPEHEPRRYDTTFLVGLLPEQADPEPLPPGEVHEHGWAPPSSLLEHVLAGTRTALPPTRAVLARLAAACRGRAAADAVSVLLSEAVLVPVVPRATWRDGQAALSDDSRGVDLLLPRHAGEVP